MGCRFCYVCYFDESHPYQRKEEKLPKPNNSFQYISVRKKFLLLKNWFNSLCANRLRHLGTCERGMPHEHCCTLLALPSLQDFGVWKTYLEAKSCTKGYGGNDCFLHCPSTPSLDTRVSLELLRGWGKYHNCKVYFQDFSSKLTSTLL